MGREVLDELKEQTDAGTSGPPGEDPRSLLREGDDGQFYVDYVDYLWAIRDELGDGYLEFLELHRKFISDRLKRFAANAAIRSKYEWLDHYHRSVLARLNSSVSSS